MPETWDLWLDNQPHSPAFNMAADEALLQTANSRGIPILRFYQWDRKAVSIGYVQAIAAAPEGFAVVRRSTGGGIVYHDLDFTYSLAFPYHHWINALNRIESYDRLNVAIQDALQTLDIPVALSDQTIPHSVDRLAMVCFTNPTRYDLMLQGRKVGGSAQRRTRQGLLHQGSLHFGSPLPVSRETLQQAMQKTLSAKLNLSFQLFTPTSVLIGTILDLVYEKYGTDQWNARR